MTSLEYVIAGSIAFATSVAVLYVRRCWSCGRWTFGINARCVKCRRWG